MKEMTAAGKGMDLQLVHKRYEASQVHRETRINKNNIVTSERHEVDRFLLCLGEVERFLLCLIAGWTMFFTLMKTKRYIIITARSADILIESTHLEHGILVSPSLPL